MAKRSASPVSARSPPERSVTAWSRLPRGCAMSSTPVSSGSPPSSASTSRSSARPPSNSRSMSRPKGPLISSNAWMNRSCAVRVIPRSAFSRSLIEAERSSCWVRRNVSRSSSSRYSSSATRLTGPIASRRSSRSATRSRLGARAIPLHRDAARRDVSPFALVGEPRPSLRELGSALPRLGQTLRQVSLDLVESRELSTKRLDPLGRGCEAHATCRQLGAKPGLVRLRALDRVPHPGGRRLERPLGVARDGDALREPHERRARLVGLSRDLLRLDLDRLQVALHPRVLLRRPLEILVAGEPLRHARLHRAAQPGELLAESRHRGQERGDLGLPGIHDR